MVLYHPYDPRNSLQLHVATPWLPPCPGARVPASIFYIPYDPKLTVERPDGVRVDHAVLLPTQRVDRGLFLLESMEGSCCCAVKRETWPEGSSSWGEGREEGAVDHRVIVHDEDVDLKVATVSLVHDRQAGERGKGVCATSCVLFA